MAILVVANGLSHTKLTTIKLPSTKLPLVKLPSNKFPTSHLSIGQDQISQREPAFKRESKIKEEAEIKQEPAIKKEAKVKEELFIIEESSMEVKNELVNSNTSRKRTMENPELSSIGRDGHRSKMSLVAKRARQDSSSSMADPVSISSKFGEEIICIDGVFTQCLHTCNVCGERRKHAGFHRSEGRLYKPCMECAPDRTKKYCGVCKSYKSRSELVESQKEIAYTVCNACRVGPYPMSSATMVFDTLSG